MRLIELQLTNIKSYKQEVIKFSEGINCILGLNGSGKSTIIESIGSVLFNYNQRTNNNLLRYNETKGQISLLFEGDDSKLYRITKTIRNKGNSNIKIIDEENNETLYETVSDVYEFVKRVLNIPKEKSLSKMFEEIIAVPQGTFVNAFLETPKNRKENFDKLFELDIYKKLSDELKVLSDKVEKEYVFKIEKEIAGIDGKLTDYQTKKDNKELLEKQLSQHNEQYKELSEIYNKKAEEKKQIETDYNKLEQFLNNRISINNTVTNLNEQIKIYEVNLTESLKAKEVLNNNLFGYNLYLKTSEELKNNEDKYNINLSLQQSLNEHNNEISKLKELNKHIEQYIYNLKKDIGSYKEQIISKEKENEENKKRISQLEIDIKPIKLDLSNKEKEKNETQGKYTYYLNKLNNINTSLLSIDIKEDSETNQKQIDIINEKLVIIEENKKQIIDLEKEKVKIVSEIDNLVSNNSYINDGLCPILKQKCLNIAGNNLSIEIEKMLESKNQRLNEINSNINVLLLDSKNEEQLIKEKETLLLQKNNIIIQNNKYLSIIEDLTCTFSHENLIINRDNDKLVISNLIKKYEYLKENFNDEILNELRNKEKDMSNDMFSLNNINNINLNIIKECKNKINNISLDILKKEEELNNNLLSIEDHEKCNDNISKQLEQYKNIKEIIDENKKVLDKYESNYKTYISKQNEASNYDKYYNLVDENKKVLLKNNTELDNINKEIEQLSKIVSKDILSDITNEVNKLYNDISVIKNTIDITNKQLSDVNKELDVLDNYIIEKQQKEKVLFKYNTLNNKYKLYRTIFNNLPKELSKQIRKYISMFASNLYRKISNENVRIEILDDYEVILVDCIEQNKQKTLSQLSGGEQMSVAIAIRLAMLKQITNVRFYFMDEPTVNLDTERRTMVGEVVKDISQELKQLFVISHDDTFEAITDNNIKIIKNNNISVLDI